MALAKRRGFIYQASEIYGGQSGFWDYGPLGAQLKKNLRDAWWEDMVLNPCGGEPGPNGEPVRIVPLDTSIIQNPRVWEASGHIAGFSDPMVDCRETKQRYRFDHLMLYVPVSGERNGKPLFAFMPDTASEQKQKKKAEKAFGETRAVPLSQLPHSDWSHVVAPDAEKVGTLTEPRAFNLMFKTYVGATATEDDVAYLRPGDGAGHLRAVQERHRHHAREGAVRHRAGRQGVPQRSHAAQFHLPQPRVRADGDGVLLPPDSAHEWYAFWRDQRMKWWRGLGLAGENLQLRVHERDELAHYAKEGAGTSDVEYRFPFTAPGFGELEGVAHRSNFDLAQHQKHSRVQLEYFDNERGELLPNGGHKGERYLPHVIEPAAGLDRGVLALLCEAYTEDPARASPELLLLQSADRADQGGRVPAGQQGRHAGDRARSSTRSCAASSGGADSIEHDVKQAIGKRYARMDEAGCPYCITIDGETAAAQSVTIRDRDTAQQTRVGAGQGGGVSREESVRKLMFASFQGSPETSRTSRKSQQ